MNYFWNAEVCNYLIGSVCQIAVNFQSAISSLVIRNLPRSTTAMYEANVYLQKLEHVRKNKSRTYKT